MKTSFTSDSQYQGTYPKVLVVGMSRTGTSSIKQALEILYEAPVYHMSVVLNKPDHLKFWSDLAFGVIDIDDVDWKGLMQGFAATTDLPTAYYFESLSKAFPYAKVILSVRDEEAWADSYCRLIKGGQSFRFIRFLPPLNRLWPFGERMHQLIFGKEVVHGNTVDRAAILAGYRRHNRKVMSTVGNERLLVFNVQQGWKPLCDFLGKEVPATSFPFLNSGSDGPRKIIADSVTRLSMPIFLALTLFIACLIILTFLI